ncbi:hypothetical protein BU17DRAFT_96882 [Hysterangium stoloniferum]|nr:hypothetical protein BU17DRAFT_96882 [Hysterangium stoloniferum]
MDPYLPEAAEQPTQYPYDFHFVSAVYNFVCLDRIIEGFWRHIDGTPTRYFSDVDQPAKFAEASIWIVQALVGDSFLTYRCWVVWGRRWPIIIAPVIFLLTTLGLGIWLEVNYSRVTLSMENVNPQLTKRLLGWEAGLVALTFFQNLFITGLIAFKLWRRHNELQEAIPTTRSALYWRAIWLIVESGMVVAFSHGVLGVVAILKSSTYQIVIQSIPFIIGIMFTGIIVRVEAEKREHSVYGSDLPRRYDVPTLPSIHFASSETNLPTTDWSASGHLSSDGAVTTSTRFMTDVSSTKRNFSDAKEVKPMDTVDLPT